MYNVVTTKAHLQQALKQENTTIIIEGALAIVLRPLGKAAPLPITEGKDTLTPSVATMYAQKAGLTLRTAMQMIRAIGVAPFITILQKFKVEVEANDGSRLIMRRK